MAAILAGGDGRAGRRRESSRPWQHGIVEAKSDAGFVFMAANGGFAEKQGLKIDIVAIQRRCARAQGDARRRARQLRGQPRRPDARRRARRRHQDPRLLLAGADLRHLRQAPASQARSDLQGKTFAISAPGALPDLLARAVLEQNGIPASEVRFAVMGSDTDRYPRRSRRASSMRRAPRPSSCRSPDSQSVKLLVHAARRGAELSALLQLHERRDTLAQRGDEARAFPRRRDASGCATRWPTATRRSRSPGR